MLNTEGVDMAISEAIREYNISIQIVSSNKIAANAAVVKSGNEHFIFFNSRLPKSLYVLCFFHEVAHIYLNELNCEASIYDKKVEYRVNIKAIHFIKPYISLYMYFILNILANINEHLLYRYFSKKNKYIPKEFLNE